MNESTAASAAWNFRSDYKAPEIGSVMKSKILVSEQDVINTYSEKDRLSCRKYFEYLKLIQDNPMAGYKKAAKLLGVKQGSTRWWGTEGKKKSIPNPLKVVQKLKEAGLLPFTEAHKDAKLIFNMLGVLFGDGGIDQRLNTVAFISSNIRDIILWRSDFEGIFQFAKNKIQVVEGGEYGHSYNIRCWDRAVIRFFAALGAPVGDKVITLYSLPTWIWDSSENAKLSFLDGYLAAEVSVPEWRVLSHRSPYFVNFSLGISKDMALEKEHLEFLGSLAKLLNIVGVKTGKIKKNASAGRIRKDGRVTSNYRILISTDYDKVLFFNEIFELLYANDKKERLERQVFLAKEHKKWKPNH
jgi:Lon-like ATP-dependent protease